MQPFHAITSTVVPLPLRDIDTDLIIPAQYLTQAGTTGFAGGLFRRLRDQDPSFPLNNPTYKESKILLTRENFGCGSSREHAAWALLEYGFRVVIAPSFADIFLSNAMKNGLVPVQIPRDAAEDLLTFAASGTEPLALTVDLSSQLVTIPGGVSISFPFDPFRKDCLLNGYEDLDYVLAARKEIEAFKLQQEHVRFSSTRTSDNSRSF